MGYECLNYAVIHGEVTPEMVREEMDKKVPKATFTLSPAARGIVNLPEIVSINQPAQILFPLTIIGQAVTLRITAERYDWTFGDGAALSVDTPGIPYSPATPCATDASCDAYVHHTYQQSSTYSIGVTVVWHGEFSVADGAWQDIPDRVSMSGAPVPLQIAEVQTVNGGR